MKLPTEPVAHRILIHRAWCAGAVMLACALSERSALASDAGTSAPPSPASGDVRRGQVALTVGLPVFNDEFVHGELSVDFRYGYKFWWLVPYLAGGFRQVRLDQLNWPWATQHQKLMAWHVTLGTRLELPASKKLLPFMGIAVERAYWAYTDDATTYCHESYYPSAWRCYKARDWKQGHSLKPQFGLIYKPEPSLALEFWLEYVHVEAPDMFTRSFTFLHPALGLAWHH